MGFLSALQLAFITFIILKLTKLQLVFIILKLTNFINWSWWLVLLPMNIIIFLMIILFLITTFLK